MAPTTTPRRQRVLPAGLALLLVGCGGGSAPPGEPRVAAGCPERVELDGGVPVVPAVEAGRPLTVEQGRLCRYDGEGALQQEAPLDAAGLGPRLLLPRAFPGQAPACEPDPGAVPLVLALETSSGPLQVGTADDPAGCAPTRIGALESAVHLGLTATGSAAPDPDASARCAPGVPGRAGQEGALAPGGATALVVCRVDGSGVRRRTATPAELALVHKVLAEPVARPSAPVAACTPQAEGELVLQYPQGPPVLVRLRPGCSPDVDNGSLAADLPAGELARLVALLP